MKNICFILMSFTTLLAYGSPEKIQMNDPNHQHDHLEHYVPADQPDVYYDSDNQTIIVDGGGEVSCYDVEIMSMTTWITVITTQVGGTYDIIDVSTLASDDYLIVITTPNDNEYEGEFSVP